MHTCFKASLCCLLIGALIVAEIKNELPVRHPLIKSLDGLLIALDVHEDNANIMRHANNLRQFGGRRESNEEGISI